MEDKKLLVAAIENGTVIDHIPNERLFDIVNMLHLSQSKSAVTIGYNLKSAHMGSKSIIKIADRFFTDEELNQRSAVAPNVALCIIRNYRVAERRTVQVPDGLVGIVRCPNLKCITNNEPMNTRFREVHKGYLRCCYCNKDVPRAEVKVVE